MNLLRVFCNANDRLLQLSFHFNACVYVFFSSAKLLLVSSCSKVIKIDSNVVSFHSKSVTKTKKQKIKR